MTLLDGVDVVVSAVWAVWGWLLLLLVVAGAGGAGVRAWWVWRAREALRERCVVALVPAAGFDPTREEIGRHAVRLARIPASAGWGPRRAAGVRVRLVSVEGQLAYRLEGPAAGAALLRMPSFTDVDVADEDSGRSVAVPRIRFDGVPPLPGDEDQGEGA
ncbi:hypothetical protein ACFV2V_16735 [Streptomyces sp. NPDC059698]|uniref:hypothetical protein n=1 Tax=unclassified Streptomyces TaxID=2593676 RepID=UPI001161216B|nr:hypothetical protein [Streptomyces sp. CB02366]